VTIAGRAEIIDEPSAVESRLQQVGYVDQEAAIR
jgi:hypothetical protein